MVAYEDSYFKYSRNLLQHGFTLHYLIWIIDHITQMSTSSSQPSPARRLSLIGSISLSAVSACFAVLFTNMPETVKTRLQLDGEGSKRGSPRQYKNVLDAFQKMIRTEGISSLQSGLGAALVYQAVMNGTRLGLYEPVKRVMRKLLGCDDNAWILMVTSGAFSGAIGATLGSPFYLIKSRLQAQSQYFKSLETHNYRNLIDGLSQVYTKEGVKGLFRGVDGALPRVMIGSATQLSTYDSCNQLIVKHAQGQFSPFQQHLIAVIVTSFITVTVMNPFDVISTRLYQSSGKATVYSGPIDCFMKTVRTEGLSALQKGWVAQYLRLGPHTIITLLTMEELKPYFLQAFGQSVSSE
jgi:solute carrier family 25, member 34/35